MSNLRVVTIYDKATRAFLRPSFVRSIEEFARDIRDVINNQSDTPLSKYPQDYVLYDLGIFSQSTGCFAADKAPEVICECQTLLDDSDESTPELLRRQAD